MAENTKQDDGTLEREVILRALKDPAFRAKLLANPREAIASVTGVSLPEGVEIKVIEQEADTVYLILPPKPDDVETEGQLSEAELASVAGGGGLMLSTCLSCSTCEIDSKRSQVKDSHDRY